MKVMVCGSRNILDYQEVASTIEGSGFKVDLIIHGGARGVDLLAKRYAREHDIPDAEYVPAWETYGKSAGFIRNKTMVEHADGVIAIWDGKSKGTKHSIDLAKKMGKPLRIKIPLRYR